ncbi:MAG: type II toxin-antitoxin system VapC family toxin [Gammaproteobacteria bacterium]|nr:type II toxin-antitoxin system VapC family toxin [Gammaproteobacteria bacterium]
MVILDTNVVSELMRPSPEPAVVAWLNARPPRDLFVTSVTEAEVRAGIAFLPRGKRRRGLLEAADRAFGELFEDRVLPFGREAARACASIAAERRNAGRPISQIDCQIAAVARSMRASLATRNVRDFDGAGIRVLDPWEHGA